MKKPSGDGEKEDNWYLELVSVTASTICLVVIGILLCKMDKQPSFHWHGITLNAVISVLATASKATLLLALASAMGQWKWILFTKRRRLIDFNTVESASSGPLGSVKLLWTMRDSPILLMGALAIILCVAFDPFLQQLVQTQSSYLYTDDADTTIVRAQRYSQGSVARKVEYSDRTKWKYIATIPLTMNSAILSGLSQSRDLIMQQLPFRCSSANCHYPRMQTLAICSTCCNLTKSIQRYDFVEFPMIKDFMRGNGPMTISNITSYSLPNGLYIDNPRDFHVNSDTIRGDYMLETSLGTGFPNETVCFKDADTLIWSITALTPQVTSTTLRWEDVPIVAEECALYYCVQEIENSVVNGTLRQTQAKINATRSPSSMQLVGEETNMTTMASLKFNPDDKMDNHERMDLMLGDGFNVSQAAVSSISFFSQESLLLEPVPVRNNSRIAINGWTLYSNRHLLFSTYPMEAYHGKNRTETTENLALSMTNAIRAGDDSDSKVTGRVGTMTAFYRVRWAWMLLPGLVLLVGLAHLVLTMRASRRAGLVAWKSSPLATLSTGYRMASSEAAFILERRFVVAMEKAAKKESFVLGQKTEQQSESDEAGSARRE